MKQYEEDQVLPCDVNNVYVCKPKYDGCKGCAFYEHPTLKSCRGHDNHCRENKVILVKTKWPIK